jgi:3-oxoacyl-(acyl-carrier-protein) synthase
MKKEKSHFYAIVGMGCVFPNGLNVEHFWNSLVSARTSFSKIPKELWESDHFYSPERRTPEKYYDNVVSFPNGFQFDSRLLGDANGKFRDISRVETYFLTALNECASKCADAGTRPLVFTGHTSACDSGVLPLFLETLRQDLMTLGNSATDDRSEWIQAAFKKSSFGWETGANTSANEAFAHQRLRRLVVDVLGSSADLMLVDAACASSLYSVEMGMLALDEGRCDVAYCGGFSFSNPLGKILFCKLGGSSRFGVFPFEERADGTVFADGAGFVAIKPLARAQTDGDKIIAVIRGIGTSSDGKGTAIYAPNIKGPVLAMRRAYESAGVSPLSIQYIEAHGTGTLAGDAVEFKSLQSFFQSFEPGPQSIGIGSVKAAIGHLGWAAGIGGLIKVILCLQHATIPAQPNVVRLNPALNFKESPFFLVQQTIPWPKAPPHTPRRAGINGFGFGGTNAHLIVEEYIPDSASGYVYDSPESTEPADFAVVGIGAVFPNAKNWDEYRNELAATPPGPNRFPRDFSPDHLKFRVIQRSANVVDRAQFLILEAAIQALSGFDGKSPNLRLQTGIVLAQSNPLSMQISLMKRAFSDYLRSNCPDTATAEKLDLWKKMILPEVPLPNEDAMPGILPNIVAGRIANFFDLQGPNLTINTGASSFLSSLKVADSYLRTGRCDVVLVGAAYFAGNDGEFALIERISNSKPTEGAFILALMSGKKAEELGFTVLARIGLGATSIGPNTPATPPINQPPSLFSAPESGALLKAIADVQDRNASTDIPGSGPSFITIAPPAREQTYNFYLDEKSQAYFQNHVVKGTPVLSGSFMIELVVQAVKNAWKSTGPLTLSQIQFLRFIKFPLNVRVVMRPTPEKKLFIRILSDFINPKGILLQKDIEHFRCLVEPSPAPSLPQLLTTDWDGPFKPLKDFFYDPAGPVYLSGPFMSIEHPEFNDSVARAVFSPKKRYHDLAAEGFATCPFLIDGAFRLAALASGAGPAVPISIEKLDLAHLITESEMAPDGPVEIFYNPKQNAGWAEQSGRLILTYKDLKGNPLKMSAEQGAVS